VPDVPNFQPFSHKLNKFFISTVIDMLLDALQPTCSYTNRSHSFESIADRKHGGAILRQSALKPTVHKVTMTFQSALKGGHM
jgi:hypothetical protein